MGATVAHDAGLRRKILHRIDHAPTTSNDTKVAASHILGAQPALLLFVGGDGTARDLLQVVGRDVPILGVPSGVKMHSAIFAATARAAGEVARRYLLADDREALLGDAEIMDRVMLNSGENVLSPELYGLVRTPRLTFLVPGAKASIPVSVSAALAGAVRRACELIADERISLIGPGSTMQALKRRLGFEGTPLSVDAVKNGRCLAQDVNEQGILGLIAGQPARIVVSVVGGQGFLFGRGNQQLSARVIREVGLDNIVVLSSLEKLSALTDHYLLVDTGDEELDKELAGHIAVVVSSARTVMMPVRNVSLEVST
jgi:predicted polyphosphate/ATP-dependent NAD kinase